MCALSVPVFTHFPLFQDPTQSDYYDDMITNGDRYTHVAHAGREVFQAEPFQSASCTAFPGDPDFKP